MKHLRGGKSQKDSCREREGSPFVLVHRRVRCAVAYVVTAQSGFLHNNAPDLPDSESDGGGNGRERREDGDHDGAIAGIVAGRDVANDLPACRREQERRREHDREKIKPEIASANQCVDVRAGDIMLAHDHAEGRFRAALARATVRFIPDAPAHGIAVANAQVLRDALDQYAETHNTLPSRVVRAAIEDLLPTAVPFPTAARPGGRVRVRLLDGTALPAERAFAMGTSSGAEILGVIRPRQP